MQALPVDKPLMDDRGIREALARLLRSVDPEAKILHELPLDRGEGRADVVSVNGKIAGFEIKSEHDSLRRLTDQCAIYDRAFDESSVVVARNHLKRVRDHIPRSWGIFIAELRSGDIDIRCIRSPKSNQEIDAQLLARILWKTESLKFLKGQGIMLDPSTPILKVWQSLAELPAAILRTGVREALKQRKAVRPPSQCDDSRTIESIA